MSVIIDEHKMYEYSQLVKRFDGLVERCVKTLAEASPANFKQGDVIAFGTEFAAVEVGTEAKVVGVVDRDIVAGEPLVAIVADSVLIGSEVNVNGADAALVEAALLIRGITLEVGAAEHQYGEL